MSRVAVVTGAARGIGAATVRRMVADDWLVVAVDRGSDDPRLPYPLGTAEELAAVAEAGGDRVIAMLADTTDPDGLAAAVARAESEFGGLDAMVAAAGVIAGGVPLWEMPDHEIASVLGVNLGGVINAARVSIPALLRQPSPRSGRFLAVASAAASRGLPMLAAYGAAKAGVAGLIRGLAVELGNSGVTANAVSPGSTDTALLDESARIYGLESTAAFTHHQPIGRLLGADEVAAAIVWLAGNDSSGLTGAVVPVDGGLAL